MVEAEPAAVDDMRLEHRDSHIRYIQGMGPVYEAALLEGLS
jgi:hypothetical protein